MDKVRKHRFRNEENLALNKKRQVLAEAWIEFTSKPEVLREILSLPACHSSRPFPTVADFLELPLVQPWLADSETTTVADVTSQLRAVLSNTDTLSRALKDWHCEQRISFIAQTPMWIRGHSAADSLGLELAITVFSCERAESVTHYRLMEEVDDPRIRGISLQ